MTRLLSFCLVGASGVVVDMGVLALLVTWTPLPLWLAKAVACEVAIASNFLGNDRWTFRGTGGGPGRGHRFLRFNGVALAGLMLNVTAFAVLVHGGDSASTRPMPWPSAWWRVQLPAQPALGVENAR